MSLVDRILIHENHAIEIVFKYKDEYQQTLEYVLGYADELDIAVQLLSLIHISPEKGAVLPCARTAPFVVGESPHPFHV